MKSARFILIISILIFVIFDNFPFSTAKADKGDDEKSIKLFGVAGISPLGVASSSGKMLIDGRLISHEMAIWGGELVQAPNDSNMFIKLDDTEEVILKRATIARLSSTLAISDQLTIGRRLIASVI